MRTFSKRILWLTLVSIACSAYATTPAVSVSDLPAKPVVAGTFTFKVSFSNSTPLPGFAPFIDLVLPKGGADLGTASGPCDGTIFISAALIGVNPANTPLDIHQQPAPCQTTPLPATVPVPHPLAALGVPSPVIVPAGAELRTIRLPYGSYDETQPPADVTITLRMHHFADVNTPLPIFYRAGFALGKTPLAEGSGDPPLLTTTGAANTNALLWPSSTVTPVLAEVEKIYVGPEAETAAGPNFPRQYKLLVRVPPAPVVNKLTGVTISDCQPFSTTFLSASAVPPTPLTAPPCIVGTYPVLNTDATVTVNFFANDTPPWSLSAPSNGCARPIKNDVTVQASWQPDDPRDTAVVTTSQKASNVFTAKALATQKRVTVPPGGILPGAVLQFAIDFQVADYLRFGNLVITDRMSDGMTLTGATLALSDKFGALGPVAFPPSLMTTQKPVTGNGGCEVVDRGTLLTFRVSDAMGLLKPGTFPANTLTGGLVGSVTATPARGTLTYTVKVDDQFQFPPHFAGGAGPDGPISPDDGFVGKNDPLFNYVEFTGAAYTLGTKPLPIHAVSCSDDSQQCLRVAEGPLTKTIVARNGIPFTPFPDPVLTPLPQFKAGDTITYRITKIVPSGDAQDITIYDWVPKPVLEFTSLSVAPCGLLLPFSDGLCYSIAPSPASMPAVTVTVEPPDSHLKVRIAPFNNPANTPITIDIYYTLTLSGDPFADGLRLTNETQECEYDSYGKRTCMLAIAAFELTEPLLRIRKGVVRTDNPAGIFNPTPPSPVAWAVPPASPAPRFTPVISSSLLAANPNAFRSDLDADGNDNVTFAVIVENFGSGLGGAHQVSVEDLFASLAPGLVVTPGSLQVTNGAGVPLAHTGTWPGVIGLTNPLPPFHPTSGANVAVFSFNARVIKTVSPGCYPNTATIKHYAAEPGGPNFVTAGYGGPFADTAQVCVRPVVTKCVIATSENKPVPKNDGSGRPQVAIGEVVRYRLKVQLPEGVIAGLKVKDLLPPGLTFLNDNSARFFYAANTPVTGGLACGLTPVSNVPCSPLPANLCPFPAGSITGGTFLPGTPPTFNMGTVQNNDNDANAEFLVIDFNAVVNNIPANAAGTVLRNQFQLFSNTTLLATSPFADVIVVEPKVTIAKSVTLAATSGTPVPTYTLVLTNPAPLTGPTAWDVALTDTFGSALVNPVIVSATATGGATAPVVTTQPGGLTAAVAAMPPQSTVTIVYKATILCLDCEKLVNKAAVTWTSLPGPKGSAQTPPMSMTPGTAGLFNGERTGAGAVPNTYTASTSATPCGKICGLKFNDLNGNGKHDAGEPALPGWTISSGAQSVVTDANGQYCLTVPAGTHGVCEEQRPPWTPTTPKNGCATVAVQPGGKSNVSFGNREPASPCQLTLKKTHSPANPVVGQKITFTVSVTRTGTGECPCPIPSIFDSIPPQVKDFTVQSAGEVTIEGTRVWSDTGTELQPGQTFTYTITGTVAAAGTFENCVSLNCDADEEATKEACTVVVVK